MLKNSVSADRYPGSAGPHRLSLVWEVCPRSRLPSDYTPTITEHCGGAALHTDSSFKRSPEAYVLLFAYKPASEGGGLSQVLSAQRLLESLSKSSDGRKCAHLLGQTRFPFQVPTAFKELYKAGLSIPEDISLVGFDDIAFAELTEPPLTTVCLSRVELGQRTVEALVNNIENPRKEGQEVHIPTYLIKRGSTAPPRSN